MKRSVFETLVGALIILGAIVFFQYSYSTAQVGQAEGYTISASFAGVGGLRLVMTL